MDELKAFDLRNLEDRLKLKGLPILEGAAREIVAEIFDWIEDGVQATDSKIDDFVLALLPPLRAFIDEKISLIHGDESPQLKDDSKL